MNSDSRLELDEIANVADPAERRARVLRKLEQMFQVAMGRKRKVSLGKGEAVEVDDADITGAVGVMREAIPLLTIEPLKPGPSGSLLGGFERPKKLEMVKS